MVHGKKICFNFILVEFMEVNNLRRKKGRKQFFRPNKLFEKSKFIYFHKLYHKKKFHTQTFEKIKN